MRSHGTAPASETRRRLAVQKVTAGWSQEDVADVLGAHRVAVSRWVRACRAAGDDGLTARPTPGRPRFLTPDQGARVLGRRADPAPTHGFRTDRGAARRVAELIRRRLGVRFHPHYPRAWLRGRGYAPQRPARRAEPRNGEAIDRWRTKDGPRIPGKPAGRTPTSS